MLKHLTFATIGATIVALGLGNTALAATFEIIASDLDNPRGLTIGSNGSLYITEAGRGGTGPCIPSPANPTASVCYGSTGALTRIENGTVSRVVTGLPSLAAPDGSEALGVHDVAFDSTGRPYVLVGLGSNPAVRSTLGVLEFGQLLKINALNGGSDWATIADVSVFRQSEHPDRGEVDSNPYSFVIQNNTAYIADAGANDLLKVNLDNGEVDLAAVFDSRLVTNPFGGSDIPMQSVPNAVASGSDDTVYVGELTGFPFPVGGARVYRVADGVPEVFAEGFTNIIDLDFDSNGNLHVLEYATDGLLSGDLTGALIRLNPDGTRTTLLKEGLFAPTSFTFGDSGDIFIANRGIAVGQGEIIRFNYDDDSESVPEPSSWIGLLAIASVGGFLKVSRR
ncbi:ScyD/ScyE family protein [Pseudanabaena sp. FACHB-2040]|uniref:ScyD/ScyE family protein n=1 Tax=Pseudanabaena sp. FACHB-2040 TaxID=2692859 RepID=UPI0016897B78|nr:ScyD/ScyE family protein [Pseudanabaena sp. FACHB-2040]MBD2261183.1 ScyD/ScyE family protein [Pseudanabaena sp. FACHB-2040]